MKDAIIAAALEGAAAAQRDVRAIAERLAAAMTELHGVTFRIQIEHDVQLIVIAHVSERSLGQAAS